MCAKNEKVLLGKLDPQAMECYQAYDDGMVKATFRSLEAHHESCFNSVLLEFIA